MTACETSDQAAVKAGTEKGLLDASRTLPPLPPECRLTERTGVKKGERLDVAVIKGDHAVTRQNARSKRCARWYDRVKKGIETPKK